MDVIEVEGLGKEFRSRRGRRTVAVDGLDLTVPEGGVFGFLGPNGSGKTTTIRCLLGLARPTSGRVRVFGAAVPAALPEVMPRVGSLLEGGGMFPTMSGRENLRLLGGLDGIGLRRVDDGPGGGRAGGAQQRGWSGATRWACASDSASPPPC